MVHRLLKRTFRMFVRHCGDLVESDFSVHNIHKNIPNVTFVKCCDFSNLWDACFEHELLWPLSTSSLRVSILQDEHPLRPHDQHNFRDDVRKLCAAVFLHTPTLHQGIAPSSNKELRLSPGLAIFSLTGTYQLISRVTHLFQYCELSFAL